jgi:hypothetical protein
MSDELRIEKEPLEVNILTIGGETLAGRIFLHPYSSLRQGREEPADLMNSGEPFFPLLVDGGVVIVSKRSIAELSYAAPGDVQDYGTMPVGVNVTLNVTMAGGKAFSGSLWVEGPVNTPRLLDFVNRSANGTDRFIALHSEGSVRLLNLAHIETIRTMD